MAGRELDDVLSCDESFWLYHFNSGISSFNQRRYDTSPTHYSFRHSLILYCDEKNNNRTFDFDAQYERRRFGLYHIDSRGNGLSRLNDTMDSRRSGHRFDHGFGYNRIYFNALYRPRFAASCRYHFDKRRYDCRTENNGKRMYNDFHHGRRNHHRFDLSH